VKVSRSGRWLLSSTTRSEAASRPPFPETTGRHERSPQKARAFAPGRSSLARRGVVLQSPLRVETFILAGGVATVAGCRSRLRGGMATWAGKRTPRRRLLSREWPVRRGETVRRRVVAGEAQEGVNRCGA
jgi:hypothetical protein